MSLFGGKSAATFFARLFDKDKTPASPEEPEVTYQRKRSQSLFAPNVSSLMAGDHVGGIGGKGKGRFQLIFKNN